MENSQHNRVHTLVAHLSSVGVKWVFPQGTNNLQPLRWGITLVDLVDCYINECIFLCKLLTVLGANAPLGKQQGKHDQDDECYSNELLVVMAVSK